jgi:ammonium transporter Rh
VITANFVALFFKHHQLDMEVALNATLAGGVIMGASCDIIVKPYYAMICGFVIGGYSAFGFCWLGGFLKEKINLHDTCGIHNLHAVPGFLGGIVSAIACNKDNVPDWGDRYSDFFNRFATGRDNTGQAGY